MKDNDMPEFDDPAFIANLALLTDLLDHLNMLDLSLQRSKQGIIAMYDCVKSFKCKVFQQLANGNLAHFKTLQSVNKIDAEC